MTRIELSGPAIFTLSLPDGDEKILDLLETNDRIARIQVEAAGDPNKEIAGLRNLIAEVMNVQTENISYSQAYEFREMVIALTETALEAVKKKVTAMRCLQSCTPESQTTTSNGAK